MQHSSMAPDVGVLVATAADCGALPAHPLMVATTAGIVCAVYCAYCSLCRNRAELDNPILNDSPLSVLRDCLSVAENYDGIAVAPLISQSRNQRLQVTLGCGLGPQWRI